MASHHQIGVLDKNYSKRTEGGKEVITLSTKALTIIWGGESCEGRYWRKTTIDSSEVAELVSAYWLEVAGKVPLSMFSPSSTYVFSITLKLKQEASGFGNSPVIFRLTNQGKVASEKAVQLSGYIGRNWTDVPEGGMQFAVPQDNSGELSFAIHEIEGGQWKKGLMIKEVKFVKVK